MPIELQQNMYSRNFTPDKLSIGRGAVERDLIHSTMYRLTLNDWSDRVQDIPLIAHHFWGTRDKLAIENGLLLKGDRVFIPPKPYDTMLSDDHDNHKGIEKMRNVSQTSSTGLE